MFIYSIRLSTIRFFAIILLGILMVTGLVIGASGESVSVISTATARTQLTRLPVTSCLVRGSGMVLPAHCRAISSAKSMPVSAKNRTFLRMGISPSHYLPALYHCAGQFTTGFPFHSREIADFQPPSYRQTKKAVI